MKISPKQLLYKLLPWLSLGWGLFSAIWMHRGFSQSIRIASLMGVVVVATMVHSIMRGIGVLIEQTHPLEKGKASAEWLSKRSLQAWSQLILMFSLPVLFTADAWFATAVTAFLAFITLWEPWYEKLMIVPAGRAALRTWSGLLSISFLLGVFFPTQLGPMYQYFPIPALLMAFPWIEMIQKKTTTLSFAPLCASCVFAVGSYLGLTHFRFPLVAIWLKKPSFFLRTDMNNRSPITSLPDREVLKAHGICFLSPVIAARDMRTQIIHEWYIDGVLTERIQLKEIYGRDENKSFNTWSCKQYLPEITRSIRIKVLLPPSAVIGEKSIHF